MHIWTLENWKKYYDSDNNRRAGLRLKFDSDVHAEIRCACKEFCKWLRKEYSFPVRVPVYVKSSLKIRALDGEMVAATFFEPLERNAEPYIRIATGDYESLISKIGKDNALTSILWSIAHELTHYFQWINGITLTDKGMERQASSYAHFLVDEYAETREHP